MQMNRAKLRTIAPLLAVAVAMGSVAGCENLPGEKGTRGAVLGGVAGGAAGAALGGEDNRLVGALIGAGLGAGGGYLIGSEMEKAEDADEEDREDARDAVREAQDNPATAEDARDADTADLNNDGFVTIDEVIAMAEAGLTDQEMIRRLRATDQIFELTPQQQDYLVANGVSPEVVDTMLNINRAERERILGDVEDQQREDVIGRPAEDSPEEETPPEEGPADDRYDQ
jgi:hypothetical protein